jgi:hypothetical protein
LAVAALGVVTTGAAARRSAARTAAELDPAAPGRIRAPAAA